MLNLQKGKDDLEFVKNCIFQTQQLRKWSDTFKFETFVSSSNPTGPDHSN